MGLDRLFRPKSVAVVGGVEAARVVEQLDLLGFAGEIWPIHPFRPEIGGRRCLPSPDDLPEAPDVAFVAVPRDATPMIVEALAGAGTGSAIVYTSGFAESGDRGLQARLVAAAGDMPLLGPNCYGFVNVLDGTAIWPDVHGLQPAAQGAAIVTQSGNIGINLTMARRGLDIGVVVTAGNQAVLDAPSLVDALLDDPRITAIGVQLESIADSVAFGRVAQRALARGTPLVALRMGSSEKGGLVTASHTGALVGDEDAYRALFARYGVTQVRTIPTFLETLKVAGRIPPQPRVVSLSSSGGEAAHVADLAHAAGVDLPELEPEHAAAIAATAGPLVAVSNPMDYHTFSWGEEARLRATFAAVLAGPFDVAMLVLDFPAGDVPEPWWAACRAFAAAAGSMPGLVVSSLPETMPVAAQEQLRAMGLIPMLGIAETIEAIAALRTPTGTHDNLHLAAPPIPPTTTTLDEVASKRCLAAAGVTVPAGVTTEDPHSARPPFPLTVKVLGIEHKTDVGGVAVGVRDASELEACLAAMPADGEYLLEETVTDGVLELLVGLRPVANMGWLLTLGAGGTLVEVAEDRVHLLAPASGDAIAHALGRLRVVTGCRSPRPPALDAAVAAVLTVQSLCEHEGVMEVEVNPLIVTPTRAVAVDAMVTVR